MIFKTLKEKCEYYRKLTDYRLLPNGYVLVMIDGKNFSSLIKNKFEKPFDNWFIQTMNETAEHVCKQIQNCKGAFVQSDEISFLIKDNNLTELPYDGRLCKLLSIIPATATSFFTKKMMEHHTLKKMKELMTLSIHSDMSGLEDKHMKNEDGMIMFDYLTYPDYVFDCKVWSVPNENDAISWFLYRQIDCVRNSKQQFCQTYLSHKQLMGLHCDIQVKKCTEETGHDWNQITEDKKYGRFLYKDIVHKTNEKGENYIRRVWKIWTGDLTKEENRQDLINKWLKEEEK